MWYLSALRTLVGLHWEIWEPKPGDEEGLRVTINMWNNDTIVFPTADLKRGLVAELRKIALQGNTPWLTFKGERCVLDLDGLKGLEPRLSEMSWFRGKRLVEPDLDIREQDSFDKKQYWVSLVLRVAQDKSQTMITTIDPPPEITHSLQRFLVDHPVPEYQAFIMMEFGDTSAHRKIVAGIKAAFSNHGMVALRSDDCQYHDDLFWNVVTYMYGCALGVAVFERLKADAFNANVSMEVGYMLGTGKPVCLIKDKTLHALHADLIGKLYQSFDPQDPEPSIGPVITKWLQDKGLLDASAKT
jgi:hypothetical protein